MRSDDVLLCLSLTGQSQSEIHDRLSTRGHLVGTQALRQMLHKLLANELVVMERGKQNTCFYQLAEGRAVEAALNAAWATAQQVKTENSAESPELSERQSSSK